MKLCKDCKNQGKKNNCQLYSPLSNYAERCNYFEQIKLTNAERIRAMTDEELAEFLSLCVSDCEGRKIEQKEFCESCPFNTGVGYCTEKRIKKWLQSELEE